MRSPSLHLSRHSFRAFIVALVFAGGCMEASNIQIAWLPVTDAERNLKAPVVDKEAGAEALFWRVHVVDEVKGNDPQTIFYHYIRVKIFNDRGRETQGTVDIPYSRNTSIIDIAGRTIKTDGAILELRRDAVFKRDIVKAGGRKVKVVSFAMPGVEPGAIIEYRYREVHAKQLANYVRLPLQRDIPTHLVNYRVKFFSSESFGWGLSAITFNAPNTPMVKDPDGFCSWTLRNVPAFKLEPMMPPEAQVRPWLLVFYAQNRMQEPGKYWPDMGRKLFASSKSRMKPNSEIRAAAEKAIAGAATPEDKIARLVTYCRTQIKDLLNDDVTEDQRQKAKRNNFAADTLGQGMGTPHDVNLLFGAMASAVGLETRLARLADRSDVAFDQSLTDDYFLNSYDIAVKIDGKWRFYDVAQKRLPVGMLRWQEEGSMALIADAKQPAFIETPISAPEKSSTTRKGVFRMAEDGTLEGDVSLQYTGHAAAAQREDREEESAAQREESVRDMVKSRFSNAEVSAVKIENLIECEKPVTYSYHVRIPGYAQRTGKRLFLQPAVFERGRPALFPTTERTYDVYFQYPWLETDDVTIKLPAGFRYENAEAPVPLTFGAPGEYRVSLRDNASGELCYQRQLIFGRSGARVFPVRVYSDLKQVFDIIHERDGQAITLRQASASQGGR
jgi:hypothetical protein